MPDDHDEFCICTCPHELLTRKDVFKAGASLAAGAALLGAAPRTMIAEARPPVKSATPGAEIVTLGTCAGPPPVAGRTGMSTALLIDGKAYVIDCGRASLTQYVNAGFETEDLAAIFITHLHADHVADLYNYFLLGAGWPKVEKSLRTRLPVYGPGSAGLPLPPAFPPGRAVETLEPEAPVPGLADLIRHCDQAYAYSVNIFARDSGVMNIADLIDVREIPLPDRHANPLGPTAPPMQPVEIARFGDVRVTGLLVPHGACFPAYAFRFDTPHGSVVFSGDTTPTPNVVALAKDADVLIHEAIALDLYRERGFPAPLLSHLGNSHTDVALIGGIAKAAGVKSVILSHLAPGNPAVLSQAQWQRLADESARRAGYAGPITVAQELNRFDLRGNRTA